MVASIEAEAAEPRPVELDCLTLARRLSDRTRSLEVAGPNATSRASKVRRHGRGDRTFDQTV
jgi:hypothetical protein